MITMQAPTVWPFRSPVVPGAATPSGTSYRPDSSGQISANPADVAVLIGWGFYNTDSSAVPLSSLSDVDISNPTDGQVLTYNSATGKWESEDGGGGGLEEPLVLTDVLTSDYFLAGVIGAAIVDAGTGGTPGASTVTTTTGTGTPAQIEVTIGAGGDIESIDSIAVAGAFTVPPDDLTYEPVTGGGLSDAALRLDMLYSPSVVGSDPLIGLAFDAGGVPQLVSGDGPLFRVSDDAFDLIAIGRGSALLNTGNNVVATGYEAARENIGNNVVAVGTSAAYLNTGAGTIAIGSNAAIQNTGDDVVAVGDGAAGLNVGDSVIAVGDNAANSNTGTSVVAIGNGAAEDNTGDNVIVIGDGVAASNATNNIINIGNVFIATGIQNPGNSVVAFPGTLTVGGAEITPQGSGSETAVAGAATLDQGSGIITSEALVGQVSWTLTLTNNKVLTTSTVLAVATNSSNLPVTVNTITEANGSVVILVGMAALTGTVIIRFAVYN